MKIFFWLSLVVLLATAISLTADDDFNDDAVDIEDEEEVAEETKEPELVVPKARPLYEEPVPSGPTHFFEPFDTRADFLKRWILSQAKKEGADEDLAKYDGKWAVEEPKDNPLEGDLGLILKGWWYTPKSSAEERPWLWGVYAMVILIPIVLLASCMCPRSGPIKAIPFGSCLIFLCVEASLGSEDHIEMQHNVTDVSNRTCKTEELILMVGFALLIVGLVCFAASLIVLLWVCITMNQMNKKQAANIEEPREDKEPKDSSSHVSLDSVKLNKRMDELVDKYIKEGYGKEFIKHHGKGENANNHGSSHELETEVT